MIKYFEGKKTYILGFSAILFGITGWITGSLDQQTALQTIWAGVISMTLRAGIK